MRVASFCSLPCGVVAWSAAEPHADAGGGAPKPASPMLTVIVKATFSLAVDGEAPLAPEQEPLRGDQADPFGDPAGLWYASDFAPRKARADVSVVGHAYAAAPTTSIAARFSFDVLDRRFAALAARPAARIPLSPSHLRASEAPGASAVVVGPRAPWSDARAALADAADFQFYNAAPHEQQLGVLRPNGLLSLDGLLPGAPHRQAWLPGHRPRVFLFGESGPSERAHEVPLVCDTLWIDTDRALCTLTWRGVVAIARAVEPPVGLVLSLEARGAAQSWAALREALPSARWFEAMQPADLIAPD
ncbi:MAG TPA: DUF2169 domain-containing protein, partial [Minicystis sp.]|nr:DUF2169 domain-containing protein [Minicystis sp.]